MMSGLGIKDGPYVFVGQPTTLRPRRSHISEYLKVAKVVIFSVSLIFSSNYFPFPFTKY